MYSNLVEGGRLSCFRLQLFRGEPLFASAGRGAFFTPTPNEDSEVDNFDGGNHSPASTRNLSPLGVGVYLHL